jgi:hypothetical protein
MLMGRLDFRNIDKEEDLEDLRKILGSMDLEDSISRLRQVKYVIDFCDCHLQWLEARLSIRFMNESIRAYVSGLDEAAIYYSSLSVELILLSKLYRKLGKYDRNQMSRFESLIESCTSEEILDERLKEKADNIRLVRDCYVHYNNWLAHERASTSEDLKLIESYKDEKLTKEMKEQAAKALEETNHLLDEIFPAIPGSLVPHRKNFMDWRQKEYEKWIQSQDKSLYDVAMSSEREHRRFGRSKFDALTTMQWSLELLESLCPPC